MIIRTINHLLTVNHRLTMTSPPFNPGIFFLGGRTRIFSETFHLTTWNIPPPHVFWASKRSGGGSSGCHILAQRWYGTPFYFRFTYIHIYIHACIQPGPGETKAEIFSWNLSRCGGGTHAPFLKYFSFYPPHPLLKGGDTMTKHY